MPAEVTDDNAEWQKGGNGHGLATISATNSVEDYMAYR
jgi:hypothetical protein